MSRSILDTLIFRFPPPRSLRTLGTLSPVRMKRHHVFYGWWIVAVTIAMLGYMAGATFWSISFFAAPMEEELGWSASTIGGVYLVQGLVSAVLAPVAGLLFDRIGPRKVAGVGVILNSLGLLLWGQSESVWQFYVAFNLAGAGFTGVFASTIPAVANWFIRRRGLAIGIASLGMASAGGMAPIVLALIEALTWRTTLTLLGVVTFLALLPMAAVLRYRPEPYGLQPDGDVVSGGISAEEKVDDLDGQTLSEALHGRTFWLLGFAVLMGYWAIGAIQVHHAPYLEGVGISRGAAAAVIALLSLMTIIGRVLFGWLADRRDPRVLMAVALAIQGVGVFVFALVDGSRTWTLAIFLLTFSPARGALLVLQTTLQGYYFGRRAFGALAGVNNALNTASWSAGPYVLGVLLGVFDSYRPGLLLFGAFSFAGIPVLLLLRAKAASSRPIVNGAQTQQ